jgi:branched-subunit amino acid aminotransferase/4-amino-4-deoxychorismate lyase
VTVTINGVAAQADALDRLVANNYGCFTSMQVREASVPGLGLHLRRLRDNSEELFAAAPDPHALQDWMRQAVAGQPDCSLRTSLLCLDLAPVLSGRPVVPDVVVQVDLPRESSTEALRVRTVAYQRETPWIKHRATHGLTREVRAARRAGYDDALLTDQHGFLTEGSFWNLCVHDGRSWVFPEAAVLDGVTQQLIQGAMTQAGTSFRTRPVHPREAGELTAAFAMNSTSAHLPVVAIDGTEVRSDPDRVDELTRIWGSITAEAL